MVRATGFPRVDDVARTRDLLNHNQVLYRLSYIHHVHRNATKEIYIGSQTFSSHATLVSRFLLIRG